MNEVLGVIASFLSQPEAGSGGFALIPALKLSRSYYRVSALIKAATVQLTILAKSTSK